MVVIPGIAAAELLRVKNALAAVKEHVGAGLVAVVSLSAPAVLMPTTGKPVATATTTGTVIGRGSNACTREIVVSGLAEVTDWTGAGLANKFIDDVEARMIYGAAICDTVAWAPPDLAGVLIEVKNLRHYSRTGDGKAANIMQLDWSMRMIVRTGDTQEIVT